MLSVFWFAAKRLFESLDLKTRRVFLLPAKPRYINLSLTYLCDSRCQMCDNWKRYKNQPQKLAEELSFEDYQIFFKDNKDYLSDLRHLGIAGGEPFLRKDLISLVKMVHRELSKVSIGLQSNGLNPKEIYLSLKEIIKFYPQITLAVSLDGISGTHDKIRGVKGAYKKVLETISLAKKAGVKEISCGMTIQEGNYDEILEVKEVVEGLGAEFSCFLADQGEYYNIKSKNDLSKKAKSSIIRSLENFSGDYYLDNLRLQLLGKRKRQLPCYSGWTSLVIDPYGEVRPCVLRSDSFGNIKKQAFREILTGGRARGIREKIKKCTCWSICEISTSAIVDPWDVGKWFLFYSNKKEFLRNIWSKKNRLS